MNFPTEFHSLVGLGNKDESATCSELESNTWSQYSVLHTIIDSISFCNANRMAHADIDRRVRSVDVNSAEKHTSTRKHMDISHASNARFAQGYFVGFVKSDCRDTMTSFLLKPYLRLQTTGRPLRGDHSMHTCFGPIEKKENPCRNRVQLSSAQQETLEARF